MESETVKAFYRKSDVVEHYARASNAVGLWESERKVFTKLFRPEETLLELGCGAGRIAFGLWALGYRNLLGIDFSKEMVNEARRIGKITECGVAFRQGDATALKFEDGLFDGAIFGFNGLMQIPGRQRRQKALQEIFRVLRAGAWFVFTTHDREHPAHASYWREEQARWNAGKQQPELLEFGDLYRETEFGPMFIHSPTREEVLQDVKGAGFRMEAEAPRTSLANESLRVREFSDDCRFWVVQKPVTPLQGPRAGSA